MNENLVRLGPREQQIAELLLQGCDNSEIARQLNMARRTVKAHFNRLFLRFGINTGIKRVKLATLLYRRQLCMEASGMGIELPASESIASSNSLPRDSRIGKLRMPSEPPSMSSRTTFEPSTTNSDCGIESNLPSGTKRANTRTQRRPKVLESWEHSIMKLDPNIPRGRHAFEQ